MDHNWIDKFIEEGQDATLSLKNFYETLLIADNVNSDHIYRAPFYDFFIEHAKEFEKTIQYYNLPQHMFYRPKTLAFEVYGTTEMWLPILRVNGMVNITEFHQPIIKLYNPNAITGLIEIFFKREGKY